MYLLLARLVAYVFKTAILELLVEGVKKWLKKRAQKKRKKKNPLEGLD